MTEKRTWQKSHPWISFRLDFSSMPADIWLLAGEIASKCEHVAGAPLLQDTANELMQVYLSKGAQATTAIEGNTLTEAEVRRQIEGTLNLPKSKEYLGFEIDNIVAACNDVLKQAASPAPPLLTPRRIMEFNAAVLRKLALDEHVQPGKYREYSVGVADYRGAPHNAIRQLVGELCTWLNQPWLSGFPSLSPRDLRRLDAVFKAIVAHLYIAWIHPFGDGNGRTARLVEFSILVNTGVPFPSAHLLSNHYNQTRSEYYRQLSKASKSGGDVRSFCLYAMRGFADQLREQIDVIQSLQRKLFWQAQIAAKLPDSATGRRQRNLVEDLPDDPAGLTKRQVVDISPRVARAYAKLDEKTLSRDLDALEKLGLVERVEGRYRAKMEIVLGYRPTGK
ncbi:MAG TPA: Fic family protein [Tepidisphaeraceae bacterium]|jgi:Fic family protein|nr:Fic family protein [Tepidisphaeraceae bacterium]